MTSIFKLEKSKPVTAELDDKVKSKTLLTTEDAKRALKEAGIADPLELTDEQVKAAERTKARRKARKLPTFDDVVRDAMLSVSKDFKAQLAFRDETERLKDKKAFDPMAVHPTSAAALIRRQRHQIMLEQGTSMTATYMQASAFWVGSVSAALMTVLSFVIAYQAHKVVLGITPFSAFVAWRSWMAYESVAEDLRFQQQARDMRAVKRAHFAEPDFVSNYVDKDAKSPLERKRELRRQQEAEAAAALARQEATETEKKKAEAATRGEAAKRVEPSTAAASTALLAKVADKHLPGAVAEDEEEDDAGTGSKYMDQYVRRKESERKVAEDKLRAAAERAKTLA